MSRALASALTVGVSNDGTNSTGDRVVQERSIRIDLPTSFTRAHVELMQKDLESILRIAAEHPEEILAAHQRVLALDFAGAKEVARSVGLTEDALVEDGGGKWGAVIVIAVIAAVTLAHD